MTDWQTDSQTSPIDLFRGVTTTLIYSRYVSYLSSVNRVTVYELYRDNTSLYDIFQLLSDHVQHVAMSKESAGEVKADDLRVFFPQTVWGCFSGGSLNLTTARCICPLLMPNTLIPLTVGLISFEPLHHDQYTPTQRHKLPHIIVPGYYARIKNRNCTNPYSWH